MASEPKQTNIDRHAYIPPQIEQAMDRQLQQSLPPHLKQYVGPNRPDYIPRQVEKSLSQAMQKNMPAHLEQYSGAYLQQRIIQPNLGSRSPSTPGPRAPTPNVLRRDHSMPVGTQHEVELNSLPVAAESRFETSSGSPDLPQPLNTPPPEPAQANPNHPAYDFIFNPEEASKKSVSLPTLPGLGSKLTRMLIVLGGLVVLIIIYAIVKSALSGPTNFPALLSAAEDQQALVHIASNATQQTDLTGSNQNLVATLQLSLNSASSQLVSYLKGNGHKVSQAQLNLKISKTIDLALTSAETAGTFNQTFDQTVSNELNSYLNDLRAAYKLTSGPKGRALLSSDYNQAKLLLTQLNTSGS